MYSVYAVFKTARGVQNVHPRHMAAADRIDQYFMVVRTSDFMLLLDAPSFITLLNPSNPKHHTPRSGPCLQVSTGKCAQK